MNKFALVTGSGKRLGREFALHLASRGYDLALHYNSSHTGALQTKSDIEKIGQRAELFQFDLSEIYAPRKLIAAVEEKFPVIDLIINSASTYPSGDKIESSHRIEEEDEIDWEKSLAVNARAPFFLMKYGVKLLRENGVIVNILDRSAEAAALSRSAHSVSKAALLMATSVAAKSFSGRYRVYGLLLGHIIPGERMCEEERGKVEWVGVERVMVRVDEILDGKYQSGEIVREV